VLAEIRKTKEVHMPSNNSLQTQVFYDGACPLCSAEMAILRHRDKVGRLDLINIAAPGFDAHAWPVSLAEMNALLHVRLPDGTWLKGMAATRHLYHAVGRGWMLAFTGWPLLSHLFDRAYAWFARNRMPISMRLGIRRCAGDTCRVPR
jgi:predicted DCC family thiol-disulfide oxidoreductase YuxK